MTRILAFAAFTMAAIALYLVLANPPPRLVRFQVCYVDYDEVPPLRMPDPSGRTFMIRPDQVIAVGRVYPQFTGIKCTALAFATNKVYVVGEKHEVIRRLGLEEELGQ